MYVRAITAMMCTLGLVGAAMGAAPEHFQPRAKELLADSIELVESEHQLNVVYFVGNDCEPIEGYERRISELLLHLQQYYGKEMARNGLGNRSFGLVLKENGNVNIHLVRGTKPHKDYPYGGGHNACLSEVNAYLDAVPGRRTSQHTFVIMPTHYDEEYNDLNPGGVPFYGLGTNCFALDYKYFDIQHWGQKTHKGRLLTKWYGGFAHELGHGLNLPHNLGTKSDNEALGTAMMGAGNYTFGFSSTYLTLASCRILAHSETFAPKGTKTEFYTRMQPPVVKNAECRRVGDKLELYVETDSSVADVNAYVQDPPYQVNRDYDAVPFACTMNRTKPETCSASLSIPLAELGELKNHKGGEMGLDLLFITNEGSRFRWRVTFDLDKLPENASIEMGTPILHRGY
ncbi:MAG: hypothetical protein IKZ07_04090 [Akkermansia sp.]|nr:hypothetical protein [Akkermansia sp.]